MFVKELIQYCRRCVREDLVTVYAAQASFYIIIAIVPFIMLLLSAVQFILPLDFAKVCTAVNRLLPASMHNYADGIIGEIFIKSGSILSFSAIALLWTASRGAAAVARGVRKVYRVPDERGFFKIVLHSTLHTVVFIGMILLTLIILVFGEGLIDVLSRHFILLEGLFSILEKLRFLIFLVLFCFFFALVYRSFSGRKVRFLSQLPGAAFSALGWIIFSAGYSIYIENFSNYSYVYGSLAAVVLMMLWLYFCMIIFLFGAELNVLLSARTTERT